MTINYVAPRNIYLLLTRSRVQLLPLQYKIKFNAVSGPITIYVIICNWYCIYTLSKTELLIVIRVVNVIKCFEHLISLIHYHPAPVSFDRCRVRNR